MKIRFPENSRLAKPYYLTILGITALAMLGILSACTSSEPETQWITQTGTQADDFAYAITVDANGNAYAAGSTGGGIDNSPNAGVRDAVLIKYDEQGSKLWSRQIGSVSWEEAYSVAVDKDGNTYVAGYTYGSIDGIENRGKYDFFLVKYDGQGSKLWSRQAGTPENDYAYSVAVDKDGNAYVAGYTYGGLSGLSSSGGADLFLTKYDPSGGNLWSQQLGTASDDIAYAVAVDAQDNAYVAGYTGAGLEGNVHMGSWDTFLAKYDATGKKLWCKQTGTTSWDEAWAVAVDHDGNAYVAGYTGGGIADNSQGRGAFDLFIIKYDPSGTKLWSRQDGTPENDYSHSIAVDAQGNAYVAGYTEGRFDDNTQAGGVDLFMVKYDTAGKKQWLRQMGTPEGDYTFGVAVDAQGNTYQTGETTGSLKEANQGAYDIFVLKMKETKQDFVSRLKQGFKRILKKVGIGK